MRLEAADGLRTRLCVCECVWFLNVDHSYPFPPPHPLPPFLQQRRHQRLASSVRNGCAQRGMVHRGMLSKSLFTRGTLLDRYGGGRDLMNNV